MIVKNPAQSIRAWLAITGNNVEWLAAKSQIPISTLYSRLRKPETFRVGELRKISKITNFENDEIVRWIS